MFFKANTELSNRPRSAAIVLIAAQVALVLTLSVSAAHAQKWAELKAEEQRALAPMQREWDTMSDPQKKKWRAVAEKQKNLPPEQQLKVQDRMQNWSKLSPDERRKARAGYEEMKQLPPDKRAAAPQKWDEYRNLPPEKQDELRKRAAAEREAPKK